MGRDTAIVVLFVLLIALIPSCTRPGVRATGAAEGSWGYGGQVLWTGTCEYDVSTRWASPLPHSIRLDDAGSRDALIIASSGRFRNGEYRVPSASRPTMNGTAMDGNTVRGSLHATVRVRRSGDSTFVSIDGLRVYRDTVPFEAECRLGDIDA